MRLVFSFRPHQTGECLNGMLLMFFKSFCGTCEIYF
jgi:hypothetical protein